MLVFKKFEQIYIYRPFIDFRKGIKGLAGFVQDHMNINPFKNYLFLFSNRKSDRIKVLYWDKNGFALWYKILEQEKFKWPYHLDEENLVVDVKKLNKLLDGLDPWQIGHKKLSAL